VIFVLLILGISIFIDFPLLLKLKDKKALIAFCVIFALAFILTMLFLFNIKMENIMVLMSKFMEKIGLSYPAY
jgi:phosphotransferase system  glucose/maltose/N-acetylglucosamine-specific IIC component